MKEFGHIYTSVKGMRIDSWGAGPFEIAVGGKRYRFEDSDRFGPALICKNGELRKHPYPEESSPFWHIHKLWMNQGRRLAEDGINCIYDYQPEENWACACVQRDEHGNMTAIRMNDPKLNLCEECGALKGEGESC